MSDVITFVGADGGSSDNGTSFSDTVWPGGLQSNDFAIFALHTINTATLTADPTAAGFALLASADTSGGSMRSRIYTKFCTGSESGGITITISSAGNRMTSGLIVYRGVHLEQPIDDYDVVAESSITATHACPQVTPQFDNGVVAALIGERATNGADSWNTSYTKRVESVVLGTAGTSLAWADDGLAVPRTGGVPVTPPSFVASDAFADNNSLCWSFSLRAQEPTGTPFRGWGTHL